MPSAFIEPWPPSSNHSLIRRNDMSDNTLSQSLTTALDVITVENELRVDSRLIAENLGIKPHNFMETLNKYQSELNELGQLPFETGVGYRKQGGGNPQKYALLNEDQAIFAMTLSRNTDQVVQLKLKLTIAFRNARQALQSQMPIDDPTDGIKPGDFVCKGEHLSLIWQSIMCKGRMLEIDIQSRGFQKMEQPIIASELRKINGLLLDFEQHRLDWIRQVRNGGAI